MLLARIVLCLAVFVPCVGLAQSSEEVPPSPSSEPGALPPPPLLPAPESPDAAPPQGELFPHEEQAPPQPGAGFSMSRAMLELLGGGIGGASLGFLSLLLGTVVVSPICDGDECIAAILLTGIVGATFGVPLGVYGAGMLQNGRGRYWPTFLGTVVGGGLGIAAALLSQDELATGIALSAGPVIGALVAYEISHAYAEPEATLTSQQSGSGLQVFPALGLTLTGGIVGGLSGRF